MTPSEIRIARDLSDPHRRLRDAIRVLCRRGTCRDFRGGRPLAADDHKQHPGCSLSMAASRVHRARMAQARLRVEAAAEAEGWAPENMWQWVAERVGSL